MKNTLKILIGTISSVLLAGCAPSPQKGLPVACTSEPAAQAGVPDVAGRVAPRYPMSAARRGIQGCVTVEFTVDENGRAKDFLVVQSTPEGIFDEATITAIEQWQFVPRKERGVTVAVPGVRSTQTFRLSN